MNVQGVYRLCLALGLGLGGISPLAIASAPEISDETGLTLVETGQARKQVELNDLVDPQGGICPDCEIELHVFVDQALANRLGAGAQPYVDEVVAAMNDVWSMPINQGGLGLGVVLSETTIFKNGDPWVSSNDAFTLLQNVREFVNLTFPIQADGRDAVILLTGNDLNTLGVGFLDALCSPYSVGLVEVLDSYSQGFVSAVSNHQLGHVAGSGHDGVDEGSACPSSGFIMGSSLNLNSPPTSFSGCSISQILDSVLNPDSDVIECLAPSSPPCVADITGDGTLNFFDVSAFLAAFSAGCP